jgi:hypothetical protein
LKRESLYWLQNAMQFEQKDIDIITVEDIDVSDLFF